MEMFFCEQVENCGASVSRSEPSVGWLFAVNVWMRAGKSRFEGVLVVAYSFTTIRLVESALLIMPGEERFCSLPARIGSDTGFASRFRVLVGYWNELN
jgi:hypothetical protein